MLRKFIELIAFIKVNWNYLPNDIKAEIVDCCNYYYDLTILAKYKEKI